MSGLSWTVPAIFLRQWSFFAVPGVAFALALPVVFSGSASAEPALAAANPEIVPALSVLPADSSFEANSTSPVNSAIAPKSLRGKSLQNLSQSFSEAPSPDAVAAPEIPPASAIPLSTPQETGTNQTVAITPLAIAPSPDRVAQQIPLQPALPAQVPVPWGVFSPASSGPRLVIQSPSMADPTIPTPVASSLPVPLQTVPPPAVPPTIPNIPVLQRAVPLSVAPNATVPLPVGPYLVIPCGVALSTMAPFPTTPFLVVPLPNASYPITPNATIPLPNSLLNASVPGATTPFSAPAPVPAPTLGSTPSVPPVQPRSLPTLSQQPPALPGAALTAPTLNLQIGALYFDSEFSARARLSGFYPITPGLAVGGILDFNVGDRADLGPEGVNVTELYAVAAIPGVPGLRIVAGQMDLTSYFDRNSFAKDRLTHFFNSTFQTNPALASANIASRSGVLVNWAITDDLDARAVVFSSARSISDFALDGFAGEVGFRVGNAIFRGTYVSSRDTDAPSADSERQEAFGANVEFFIPEIRLGLFGRYGRLNNFAEDFSADTFSVGLNLLDVFTANDRLGLAYGRNLYRGDVDLQEGDRFPDVLELFYDLPIFPNTRLGFSIQQVDSFSETIAGVRFRTNFDILSGDSQ